MKLSPQKTQFLLFYKFSLLLQQSSDLQHRAVRCPGFLHTAVLCYTRLLQIYLDGHELTAASELSHNQVTEPQITAHFKAATLFWHVITHEPYCQTLQILGHAKQFLLGTISQMFPAALSSIQLTQVTNKYTVHMCIVYHLLLKPASPSLLGFLVQLQSRCAELDPEVASALSVHLDPHSLSPEMDFLWMAARQAKRILTLLQNLLDSIILVLFLKFRENRCQLWKKVYILFTHLFCT